METMTQEIQINLPFEVLTGIVGQLGREELLSLRSCLDNALSRHQETPEALAEEDWLDVEYMEEAAQQGDDRITLEEVRAAMAKIPDSLTADFIAAREER
jgi:hypothetical protein